MAATSSEAERSFSSLRRLKTYLRSTMTQDRLTGLAMLHIHYLRTVLPEEVVDIFLSENHRISA